MFIHLSLHRTEVYVMSTNLKYMTWMEFDELRKKTKAVILPTGAVEVYGPHLPLGSDIIISKKIADLLGERSGALVAPSLEIGNSNPLYCYPGTIYCRPETIKAAYRDLCESLIKWGFRVFLVLNMHRNNAFPLDDLMMELQDEYGIIGASVPWWQFLPSISQDVFDNPNPKQHAGEAGTSIMLHLAPELVRMDRLCATEFKLQEPFPNITQ